MTPAPTAPETSCAATPADPRPKLRESAVDRVDDLLAAGLGGGQSRACWRCRAPLDDVPHGGCGGLADRARSSLGQVVSVCSVIAASSMLAGRPRSGPSSSRTECRTTRNRLRLGDSAPGMAVDRAADRCTGSGAGDCVGTTTTAGQPRDGGEWIDT
ncbi:hypothetical protein GS901_06180 [Rhodococcus hoagii]|nr:hypothetical protein [Prescottella equi]